MKRVHLFAIFIILLFLSCNSNETFVQSASSKYKLDSLHSGFNTVELTKQNIKLNKDTVSIVAFGHVYGLLEHEDVFDLLIETVNSQNPDYVWILGDIVYNNTEEEWDYLLTKYKGLSGLRFHAGGNHDMNYHYERYHGKNENQWEAEMRYLNKIHYRYLTIEDDIANYMLINMNDSLDRIASYLDLMIKEMNNSKAKILFTHHATWHDNQSESNDPTTWVKKSFSRDSLLPKLYDFDYMIYGDWSEGFYMNTYKHKKKKFMVMDVGNLRVGDSLHITSIKLTKDTLWANPISINIPIDSKWYINKEELTN